MTQWQAVSKTRHHNAGWMPYTDHRFASEDMTCPLLAAEITHAVVCFPIAFAQTAEGYQLVVLQSLQTGVNLYVDSQGQWLAPYVPAWYRSHPLRLLQSQDGEHVLCVDEDSASFTPHMDGKQRFFDDVGEITPALREVIEFLQQCRNNHAVTHTLVKALIDARLISTLPLQFDTGHGRSTPLAGIFHIDEAALQSLAGEQLSPLAQSGALAIAYAQLLSATRLIDFSKRYQKRALEQARQTSGAINLDDLFGDQSETVRFGL